jgi:hypothetical protein
MLRGLEENDKGFPELSQLNGFSRTIVIRMTGRGGWVVMRVA